MRANPFRLAEQHEEIGQNEKDVVWSGLRRGEAGDSQRKEGCQPKGLQRPLPRMSNPKNEFATNLYLYP